MPYDFLHPRSNHGTHEYRRFLTTGRIPMPPDKEPRKTVIGVENEYGIHWPSFFRLMGIERQNQYAQDTPAYQATLLFTNYLKYALERPAPFVSDKFEFPWMSPNISVWHVNGSRIYPDLSHPEYATPETGDPRNAALYIKAGEYLFDIVLRGLNQRISGSSREEIVHAIRQKYFEFFQAEDGIRDDLVTGVQTCALPI